MTGAGAALEAMLGARSMAVVGASARPDSFGLRMTEQALRSPGLRVHPVNPGYAEVAGLRCVPTIADVDEPVDVALLGVGDGRLVEQLDAAARAGARSAVVFGSAHGDGLRAQLRTIACDAGMALCGAGCMGYVDATSGLRAVGYVERDDIPAGPVSVVTHSGSVFSTLLRTRRAIGFDLAVSSGQELVTTTADYLRHMLDRPTTRVVGLVLETVRDGTELVVQLHRAASLDVPVVVLPVGGSPRGSALVAAHSGALAGAHGTWEALAEATGVRLVADLAELTDTVEAFAIGRRPARRGGIATVHDSGAERALVVDLAHALDVPLAEIGTDTRDRLGALLDGGLTAENPLDVWGTGAGARALLRDCLLAMAADPAVAVTALAVDLVAEYDGDTSYADAVLDTAAATGEPIAVLANLASAVDEATATRLRSAGVPVLEGTRSGLVALRNLLASPPMPVAADIDPARRDRWTARLDDPEPLGPADAVALLADYGLASAPLVEAADEDAAAEAARTLGFPVVLKTAEPDLAHKSDVGGVVLGLADEAAVRAAYRDLAERLGKRAVVAAQVPAGVELSVGLTRDPALGPLVVVAAGGVLVELLDDRAVGLPPLDRARARALVDRLRLRPLLDGLRGAPPADVDAVVDAVLGVAAVAVELGECIEALDVNPVVAGPHGAVALDALIERRDDRVRTR